MSRSATFDRFTVYNEEEKIRIYALCLIDLEELNRLIEKERKNKDYHSAEYTILDAMIRHTLQARVISDCYDYMILQNRQRSYAVMKKFEEIAKSYGMKYGDKDLWIWYDKHAPHDLVSYKKLADDIIYKVPGELLRLRY